MHSITRLGLLLVAVTLLAAPARLANGVYRVVRDSPDRAAAVPVGPNQRLLVYDRVYTEADRNQPPRHIVIDTGEFVPLILAGPPDSHRDERGWTALTVTLAREHVKTLAAFSRKHLDGKVAVVLDGEILSIHKVRAEIADGKFMLTRCTDDACQVIKGKLAAR